MIFCDDFYNNLQLLAGIQEDIDFTILSDEMFQYLYSIYGGTDIRRVSIKIQFTIEEQQAIELSNIEDEKVIDLDIDLDEGDNNILNLVDEVEIDHQSQSTLNMSDDLQIQEQIVNR